MRKARLSKEAPIGSHATQKRPSPVNSALLWAEKDGAAKLINRSGFVQGIVFLKNSPRHIYFSLELQPEGFMKFPACGLFGAIPIFLLSLLTLAAISYADAGPPPPSLVLMHLVSGNGAIETGIAQITYHCTYGPNGGTGAQISIPLNCSNGGCTNEPYRAASECVYFPAGYFTYNYNGENKSSETFNATALFPGKFYQHYYEYQLDVQTGKITPISASNGPDNSPCAPALLIFGTFAGAVAVRWV